MLVSNACVLFTTILKSPTHQRLSKNTFCTVTISSSAQSLLLLQHDNETIVPTQTQTHTHIPT